MVHRDGTTRHRGYSTDLLHQLLVLGSGGVKAIQVMGQGELCQRFPRWLVGRDVHRAAHARPHGRPVVSDGRGRYHGYARDSL